MGKIDANSTPEPRPQRSSFNSPVVESNSLIEGDKTYKVFTEKDGCIGMFNRKTAFAKVEQLTGQGIKARAEYVGKRFDTGFRSRKGITD